MGFNRRKMEADRKACHDSRMAARRATDPQVREDAERLIGRQASHMPLLFTPTIIFVAAGHRGWACGLDAELGVALRIVEAQRKDVVVVEDLIVDLGVEVSFDISVGRDAM